MEFFLKYVLKIFKIYIYSFKIPYSLAVNGGISQKFRLTWKKFLNREQFRIFYYKFYSSLDRCKNMKIDRRIVILNLKVTTFYLFQYLLLYTHIQKSQMQ